MQIVTRNLCYLRTVFAAATIVAVTSVLPGCNGQPAIVEPAADTAAAEFGCDDKLNSALEMLRPERLGISTDAETAQSRLNTWLKDCGQEIDAAAPPGPEIQQLLEPVLSPTQRNWLTAGRFVSGDAEHIRNCRLHKAMAKQDLISQESELERIVELFHFCVRNIALHTSEDERLPLTPFEILLFGRGDPQDVAWVYADVLRQLQIDAVILRPAMQAAHSNADDRWLVGVLLNEQVYLFDPRLGTPIPGPADTGKTPTVRQPATLSDVLKDDGLLRKLDVVDGQPYSLTAEALRQVTVLVVGSRSLWTSPMQRLNKTLAGERSAVVFDGLQDDGDSPGLMTRVADYGGENWGTDDVSIWPYPQQQLEATQRRDEFQRKRLSELESPLDAPVPVAMDAVTRQIRSGTPERRYIRTRIVHLLGDLETAIRNYQKLRIRLVTSSRLPLPEEIRAMHASAEDDAAYWIGLCQFDRGNLDPALSTFRDYLRRYRQNPDAAWTIHCQLMLALSLAETGDWSEALFELEIKDMPKPLAARSQFWNDRWKSAKQMAE